MANNYFKFKNFTINQENAAFKVGTDGVLLGACAELSGVKRILDIGTGTGLLAIMLAQRCEAEIVAIEPDYNSYLQAVENVNGCPWSNRVNVIHSDLQGFDHPLDKFDLIITNPPYFSDSLKNPDPRKSGARHNDSLSSGDLLSGVSELLSESGRLQLILPYVEGNLFIAEARSYSFYCNNILKIKPLPTSEVRRLILTFGRQKSVHAESFLTIEKGRRHDFTDEYISLTKDFYLRF